MPNLCCVLDCRTGKGNNKATVPLFRLPSDKDEPERRKKWICALVAKNNGYLSVSESTVVCEKITGQEDIEDADLKDIGVQYPTIHLFGILFIVLMMLATRIQRKCVTITAMLLFKTMLFQN